MHIQLRMIAMHVYSMHQCEGTLWGLKAAVKYAEQEICAPGWEPPSCC